MTIKDLEIAVEGACPGWLEACDDSRTAMPRLARDRGMTQSLQLAVASLRPRTELRLGDARDLSVIEDESVHLVLTSPPYWTLKTYRETPGQMGHIADYEMFLDELDQVWRECLRVLAPGGRAIVVVGDVCVSRKESGRHMVVPLHASIQERCRQLGFDNLAPIIWYKISNAVYEVNNGGGGFLGKPYEPNAVIKNDIEFILMQRKPGGYRSPSLASRALSVIPETEHKKWFRQIWDLPGASTNNHPAPFPLELAERLIRMFSFVGDTVLDPFSGTGTTCLAASRWARHSIGYEIDPVYLQLAVDRLNQVPPSLFSTHSEKLIQQAA